MNCIRRILGFMLMMPILAVAQPEQEEAVKEHPFAINGYGKIATIREADGWKTTNPHLLVGVGYFIQNGWLVFGEGEMNDEFCITQLYVQKAFSERVNIRLGKMTIPLGMANLYASPTDHFSVFLPEGEETVLPTESNRTGLSFSGEASSWHYELQYLLYQDTSAVVAHFGKEIGETFGMAASGYFDGKFIASADVHFDTEAVAVRAIGTYSQRNEAWHTGIEAGYNILHLSEKISQKLFLFSRHDYTRAEAKDQIFTIGLNYQPLSEICIKAEYARKIEAEENRFAIGVGFSF